MALVASGFACSVSITDTSGSVSTLRYELDAADAAAAALAAGIIVGALADMTQGVISAYTVGENFVEDALTLPANAENAIKASLTAQLAGSNKKANLQVPAPADGIFVSATGEGYNVVNTAAPAVLAYAALFYPGAQAFLSDGENIQNLAGFLRGRRVSRASVNP